MRYTKINKKAMLWWQVVGSSVLILFTLALAIFILGKFTGKSFGLISKLKGLFGFGG